MAGPRAAGAAADAEDDEADRETQPEEDEHPLGLASQLREEHLPFDVPVLGARRGGAGALARAPRFPPRGLAASSCAGSGHVPRLAWLRALPPSRSCLRARAD